MEDLAGRQSGEYSHDDFALFNEFKAALNRGEIRAAERGDKGNWQTNAWVKRGILLGFRMGVIVDMSPSDRSLQFLDKNTYPIRSLSSLPGPQLRVRPRYSI